MSRNGKGIAVVGAAILTLGIFLTACGSSGGAGSSPAPENSPAPSESADTQTVHGVINKIDSYLVLLTEDGEYQIMDYSRDVVLDNFAEGDTVDITYTGQLGDESASPMIVSIAKSS